MIPQPLRQFGHRLQGAQPVPLRRQAVPGGPVAEFDLAALHTHPEQTNPLRSVPQVRQEARDVRPDLPHQVPLALPEEAVGDGDGMEELEVEQFVVVRMPRLRIVPEVVRIETPRYARVGLGTGAVVEGQGPSRDDAVSLFRRPVGLVREEHLPRVGVNRTQIVGEPRPEAERAHTIALRVGVDPPAVVVDEEPVATKVGGDDLPKVVRLSVPGQYGEGAIEEM